MGGRLADYDDTDKTHTISEAGLKLRLYALVGAVIN